MAQEEQKPGAPLWMATFADMMSLLLTFFVLLLSMAEIDATRFRKISGS
ncbi:MAG: flagellar motor protein MotB, partial [Pseudomonadota bacterium]